MAQINLKNTGDILTPPSGSIALGISGENIIVKNDQGNVKTIIGGEPLPEGGSPGQILSKKSTTNFDAEWVNIDIPSGETVSDYLYLSDYSLNIDSTSGTETIKIYSTKNWTLTNGTFVSASQTSGSTGVTQIDLTYTQNETSDIRNDKITISSSELGISQSLSVNQKSAVKSTYYLSLSDNSLTKLSGDTSASFTVSSTNDWSLTTDDDFVLANPVNRTSENTTVNLTFSPNSSSTRYARIIITDGITTQSLKLTQLGVVQVESPFLELSDSVYVADKNSGTTTFTVNSSESWTLIKTTNAITSVSPENGPAGETDVTVTYNSYPADSYTATRSDKITINNTIYTKNFSLTQTSVEASVDYLNVDPNSDTVSHESSAITFDIDSNISWEIPTTISGITINPTSWVSGRTSVTIDYPENTSAITQKRIIRINPIGSSISYRNFTLSQLPPTDKYYIVSQSGIVASSGDTSIDISISSNVDWEIKSNATWFTTFSPSSGNSDQTVNLTIETNSGETTRQGSFTISCTDIDKNVTPVIVTISQYGSVPTGISKAPNLIPKSKTVSYHSGTYDFQVESARSWSITEDIDWLTLSPSGGTGNSPITITYEENKGNGRASFISVTDVDENTSNFFFVQESAPNVVVKPDGFEISYSSGYAQVDIRTTGEWEAEIDNTYGINNGIISSVVPSSGTTSTSAKINYTSNSGKDFRYGIVNFVLKSTDIGTKVKIKQGFEGGDSFGNIGGSEIEDKIKKITGTTEFSASLDDKITDSLSTSGFVSSSGLDTAISDKITDTLSTSGFVSSSGLDTAINDKITDTLSTSGFVSSSGLDTAISDKITDTLSTSGFVSTSGLDTAISDKITDTLSTSGFVSTSGLDTAISDKIIDTLSTSGFVSTSGLNNVLSSYVSTSGLDRAISDKITDTLSTSGFVSTSGLNNVLSSYVSTSGLDRAISDKITDTLSTSGFVSTSGLNTVLSSYVSTSGLDASIGDVINSRDLVTSNEVETLVQSGVTESINKAGLATQSFVDQTLTDLITLGTTGTDGSSVPISSIGNYNKIYINTTTGQLFVFDAGSKSWDTATSPTKV